MITLRTVLISTVFASLTWAAPGRARAADAVPAPSQKTPAAGAQKLDVDSLKQKYWAKGNERQLEVVQNRVYTKAHKFTAELTTGMISGDPFQNTIAFGGSFGYYFNEYVGVDVLYWKATNSTSGAYDALVTAAGFGSNSNPLQSLLGAELSGSILYGKLSLLGKAILHFDLMLRLGLGTLSIGGNQPAQSQSSLAPWVGIGQQLFLTHWLSFHTDYRMLRYSENVVEQFKIGTLGNVIGNRTTYAGALTAGFSVLF